MLEQRAAQVIDAVTGTGLKIEEGEEKVDVCKAIVDMKREAAEESEQNKAKRMAIRMIKAGKISLKDIADYTELPLDIVKELEKQEML